MRDLETHLKQSTKPVDKFVDKMVESLSSPWSTGASLKLTIFSSLKKTFIFHKLIYRQPARPVFSGPHKSQDFYRFSNVHNSVGVHADVPPNRARRCSPYRKRRAEKSSGNISSNGHALSLDLTNRALQAHGNSCASRPIDLSLCSLERSPTCGRGPTLAQTL